MDTAWARPRARTWASTSGRMPLESSLTGRPKARRSYRNGSRPGSAVGSPPDTTMPSSQAARILKKRRTSDGKITGWRSGRQARSALWQVGQRRLQPPRKMTQHVRPGQSQRLKGVRPRRFPQALLSCSIGVRRREPRSSWLTSACRPCVEVDLGQVFWLAPDRLPSRRPAPVAPLRPVVMCGLTAAGPLRTCTGFPIKARMGHPRHAKSRSIDPQESGFLKPDRNLSRLTAFV